MDNGGMWFGDWISYLGDKNPVLSGWLSRMEGHPDAEPVSFVYFAKQELLRLIVDIQQNRNRPEDLA